MKRALLLSKSIFFLIVATLVVYNASSVYGADKKEALEINKILQSGFNEVIKGNLDTAISHFNKAVLLNEKNSRAYAGLGHAYLRKGDIYNAIGYFNKAISLDEKNPYAYAGLGNAYIRKGDIYNAIGYFNKAISLDEKDYHAYVSLGNAYLCKGFSEKAIAYFNKAISLDEKNSYVYASLGNAYLCKGFFEKAMTCFNKAILLDEKNSHAYYNLGLLYLSLNKEESALEKYKILENLNKDLADKLYEQIQLRFSVGKLMRRILFMRSTDNLYLHERDRKSITLYIDKGLSKNDILTRENPVKSK